MNINKFTGGLDPNARTRTDQVADKPSQTQAPQKEQSASYADQVKLSASSKSIQQIEAEIRDMPEVDDATVERIRSALSNGEYKIDYERLAGKMLDFDERLN
ncbi:flagellar biosynthesis anti-sigma factor FlgM [Bacterioplanes sanyensis]|uniref:Negative regulator of flagellin synthesis n=2 Tax=Bacterioplanes sanyensis TaxID=1249553 RepID=A0A222FPQ9_9GAMM|nr:flagellar biosynthesis anti-sigma factor FlgM [Bacterioplanes sanyensis]